MKTLKKILITYSLMILSLGIITLSCSKTGDKSSTDTSDSPDNKATTENDDRNIVKTGEDVLNADYQQFYDDLSPYGKWIKISRDDLGLKSKGKDDKKKNNLSDILNFIPGINNAYADTYASWDFFFVWQPSPDLSVGIVAGEPQPAYVPYVHGRWIYTDRGWYFRAPTYCEEVVHHYGRWCYNDDYGWVWIPGRVWAPAWVSWEEDDDYVGWAPCETSVFISDQYYVIPTDRYVYVTTEKRYFLDPEVYRYAHVNRFDNNRSLFNDMRRFDGLSVNNRIINNNGPDVKHFDKFYGKDELRPVKINTVNDVRNVNYGKNEYKVYAPEFKSRSDIRSSGNNFPNKEQAGKNNNDNRNLNSSNTNRIDKNKIYSDKIDRENKSRETSVLSNNIKGNNSSRNMKTDNGTVKNNKDYTRNNGQNRNDKIQQKNSGQNKSYGLKKTDKQSNNNYNKNNNQKKPDIQNNNNRNYQKQNNNQQRNHEKQSTNPPNRNINSNKSNNNNNNNRSNNNNNRSNNRNNNSNNNNNGNNNREHKK